MVNFIFFFFLCNFKYKIINSSSSLIKNILSNYTNKFLELKTLNFFRDTSLGKNPHYNLLFNHLINYPTPLNLTYWWGLGSLAGLCIVIQILTGIFLAMHYTPNIEFAFQSVEHIMRDINNGWFIRYMHANGASFFFIVIYLHIGKGLYYSSYLPPRHFLWINGGIIFLLLMATAFMGYVLPWGQMSFWGATVITNLFTAIPYFGNQIAFLLWGGFSVSNATLTRFFSLHYFLPFLICGMICIHLILLHIHGSSNILGFSTKIIDKIAFYPYFIIKDIVGVGIFLIIFFIFIFFYPNLLGHTDNYIEANSLVTPTHIVPEWYFLPFYAILRSIPNKLGGVICMGLAVVLIIFLPNVRLLLFQVLKIIIIKYEKITIKNFFIIDSFSYIIYRLTIKNLNIYKNWSVFFKQWNFKVF
jgi:ubiquinol-cytochrome c reductase cytochrome b subunit